MQIFNCYRKQSGIFFISILLSIKVYGFDLNDSSSRFFQEVGFESSLGYMNINVNRLNSYFTNYTYGPIPYDYGCKTFRISLGNDNHRFGIGFQSTNSINFNDNTIPKKLMRLDNIYFFMNFEESLIRIGRFNIPLTIGFCGAQNVLSLINSSQVPYSAVQAGSIATGSTVLSCNTLYLPVGLKPTFTIYKNPKKILYKLNISIDFVYSIDITSVPNIWLNQTNNMVSGMPNNRFNSYYIGFFDLEGFIKR